MIMLCLYDNLQIHPILHKIRPILQNVMTKSVNMVYNMLNYNQKVILMNILICDDDALIIEQVKNCLTKYENAHNCKFNIYSFTDSNDVADCNIKFNIAILDVEMPQIDGIQLGKMLKENNKNIMLIFLTAYSRYIDDALDLEAARFFEKPLDIARFNAGLNKILSRLDEENINIFVTDDKKEVSLNSSEIMYVEIKSRKTRVVTQTRAYVSSENIAFWQYRLCQSMFARTHKSYVVNMNYIKQYQPDILIMENGDKVPIAKSNKYQFKKTFMRYMEQE